MPTKFLSKTCSTVCSRCHDIDCDNHPSNNRDDTDELVVEEGCVCYADENGDEED